MRTPSLVCAAWLLVAFTWNSEAFPASDGHGITHLAESRAESLDAKASQERAAVRRDLTELHLIEEVLSDHSRQASSQHNRRMGETGDTPPSDDELSAQLEDRSAFEHHMAVSDPLLPPVKLIKNEENATAREDFKGPHADVSRQIVRVAKNVNKEVFGGENEAKTKMDSIKKDAEKLAEKAKAEAKELGVELPKPIEKIKAKKHKKDPFDESDDDHEKSRTKSKSKSKRKPKRKSKRNSKPKSKTKSKRTSKSGKKGKDELGSSQELSEVQLAAYAVQEIKEKTQVRKQALKHQLSKTSRVPSARLGEDANPNTKENTKSAATANKSQRTGTSQRRPVKQASKFKENTPTLQAIKLEEEEIVRAFRNKPAKEAVDTLNQFMHKAHEAREKGREAWMTNKEVQAKDKVKRKQRKLKAGAAGGVATPADMLSVREGKREHVAAVKKAQHDAEANARQLAANKSARKEAALKTSDKKPGQAHDRPTKVLSHGKTTAASPTPTKIASNKSSSKPENQPLAQERRTARKPNTVNELGSSNNGYARKAGSQQQVPQRHRPASKTEGNQPTTHTRNGSAQKAHSSTGAKSSSNPPTHQNRKARQGAPADGSLTAIQEQRPSAAAVQRAMAEFGPGGTHCKDCT